MILLSFDIEEFDMPFEYGKEISFNEQMKISIEGSKIILDILEKFNIKATFFSTATFAINAPDIISRIVKNGHEIGSHTYYHSDFKVEHLLQSRLKLEELTGQKISGFRMPRMHPVDENEVFTAGYTYNSSVNPTYLPGRYNNFHVSRTYFYQANVLQIPASVTPIIRFPLFWLSFHNLPLWLYQLFCNWTVKTDKYLNIYFHPWEFTDLNQPEKFNFPSYVSKNSGRQMTNRLELFINWAKKKQYSFGTFTELIESIPK